MSPDPDPIKFKTIPFVRKTPSRLHLELTTHCNLKCVFCSHTDFETVRHLPDLVASVVINDLLPNCLEIELQGTGESLMYPGFDAVISAARARGCLINLITNGHQLTGDRMKMLIQSGCQIVVSMDGGTSQIYEWHRRGGQYNNLLTNLKNWKHLSKVKFCSSHAASLIIHTTLTSKNINELIPIVQLSADLKVDGVFVSVIRRARSDDQIWRNISLEEHRDKVEQNLMLAEVEAHKLGIYFASSSPFGMGKATTPRALCPSPWSHAYISVDGDVYPCCQFKTPLGNCIDTPFQDIWRGSAFHALRSRMTKMDLPEECKNCVLPWRNG